jgi:hypothetical protein
MMSDQRKLCSNCVMHNQCCVEKAMNGKSCASWANRLYGDAKKLLKETINVRKN